MKNNQKLGFTMIEMLIALGIFSVIALGLYGVFWNAIQINQRAEVVNGVYREARWSSERLMQDLENIIPYNFGSGYSKEKSFISEDNKITFVTSGADGIKVVSYYSDTPDFGSIFQVEVEDRGEQRQSVISGSMQSEHTDFFVREEYSLIDYLQFTSLDSAEKEVLSIHLKSKGLKFWFAYKERSEGSGTVVWRESWNENYPPYGVRVEMTFFTGLEGEEDIVLTRDVLIPSGTWGESKIEIGI